MPLKGQTRAPALQASWPPSLTRWPESPDDQLLWLKEPGNNNFRDRWGRNVLRVEPRATDTHYDPTGWVDLELAILTVVGGGITADQHAKIWKNAVPLKPGGGKFSVEEHDEMAQEVCEAIFENSHASDETAERLLAARRTWVYAALCAYAPKGVNKVRKGWSNVKIEQKRKGAKIKEDPTKLETSSNDGSHTQSATSGNSNSTASISSSKKRKYDESGNRIERAVKFAPGTKNPTPSMISKQRLAVERTLVVKLDEDLEDRDAPPSLHVGLLGFVADEYSDRSSRDIRADHLSLHNLLLTMAQMHLAYDVSKGKRAGDARRLVWVMEDKRICPIQTDEDLIFAVGTMEAEAKAAGLGPRIVLYLERNTEDS